MKTCCKCTSPTGKGSAYCHEHKREAAKRAYRANPEKYRAATNARRAKNPDHCRARERRWAANNPDLVKGKSLQKYWPGSSAREALAKFRALVDLQNNTCASCKRPETCRSTHTPHDIRDLCVDHDHTSGIVRGLLCDDCNVLIGRARDSAERCRNAGDYLERFYESLSAAA